jgi:predicted O-methyltransferase YrrM
LWQNDAQFEQWYAEIKGTTLVTKDRCFMLYQYAKYASHLPGDFAEIGVFRGGTAKLTAKAAPTKQIHLFDTFAGMPKTDAAVDVHQAGDFADTSLESVKAFLKDCRNLSYYPGFFPQTAVQLKADQFSFVYIDTDIYQSVKDSLEYFYPRTVPGGVIICDDYLWKDCPGVKKAIDEFLKGKNTEPVISALYQCVIIKR